MSGVLNVTQLIGVISSLWTMDRFGRRTLLLTGSVFMFIAHLIISVLVGKFSDNWPAHRAEGWASVSMLLFFMLAFGASWGPVPWALPSEIFPSSLRAKGVGLSTASNWFFNFIIVSRLRDVATLAAMLTSTQGLITPPLVEGTGYGAYVFFAVFCLLSFVWTFFVVPETSGKTLEQMDSVFKDISSIAEEQRRERIEREIANRSAVSPPAV